MRHVKNNIFLNFKIKTDLFINFSSFLKPLGQLNTVRGIIRVVFLQIIRQDSNKTTITAASVELTFSFKNQIPSKKARSLKPRTLKRLYNC